MAILMQHSWHIQVTQKAAARDQRFVISGAASANGSHAGTVGQSVIVTGTAWSVTIQSKVGSTWINSTEKIQFPSAGCTGFTIFSDDFSATPDLDFNDLVLHCTPIALSGATDYFVYGHVSYFEGCVFNPCFRDYIVLDSHLSLLKALEYPALRDYIKHVYPDRAYEQPVQVPGVPVPPQPPFKPLMLPLQDNALIPQKEAILFRKEATTAKQEENSKEEKFTAVSSVALGQKQLSAVVFDRVKLTNIADRLKRFCNVESYQSALLRFVEYDRTASELAGGPYTGTGTREILGNVITDSFGNYVFRFQRSVFQSADELSLDVAPGESFSTQIKPDLIVQVMDPSNLSHVMYESGLYSNISPCRRVNICVPKSSIGPVVNACAGQSIIQYIGDILVAATPSGDRGGSGYILHNSGRISGNGLKCAAWRGRLNMISCRLTDPAIAYYTVRYRRSGIGWTIVTEDTRLPKLIGGSFFDISIRSTQNLQVDGNPPAPTSCYVNVETVADSFSWITSINYKAFLSTGNYTDLAGRGRVEFRIEGYRADGTKIASVDDTIGLYLDNHIWTITIDPNVTMAGTTLGNCALFSLPPAGGGGFIEDAPLEVRFQANQESGFMGAYALTIGKGAIGNINLLKVGNHMPSGWNALPNTTPYPDGGTLVGREYSFSPSTHAAICAVFTGTADETGADSDGDFIRIKVKPPVAWLEPGQNFCAFRLRINGHIRHTDGDTYWNPSFASNEVLIGIERPV